MAWNRTGTVTVTLNSVTVTGVGTVFLQESRVGDGFRGPDGGLYEVINIVSNTQLTLAKQYKGPTLATQPFDIIPVQGYQQKSADELRAFVNKYGAFLDSKGLYAMSLVAPAADRLFYFTGAETGALAPFTAKARELVAATTEAAMRTALGLGTSAVLAVTTSQIDMTANRLLKTSDFGIGSAMQISGSTDLNTITQPGEYAYSSGPTLTNSPLPGAILLKVSGRAAWPMQEVVNIYGTAKWWRTCKVVNPTAAAADWNEWFSEEGALSITTGDCNAINQNGRYITSAATANIPVTTGGSSAQGYLEHFQYTSTDYSFQRWTQRTTGTKYYRLEQAGVWQAWVIDESATVYGIGAQVVLGTASLDTLRTGGKYITQIYPADKQPLGWDAARLLLDVTGGEAYAMQFVMHATTGKTATRLWGGGTTGWSSWREDLKVGDYGIGVPVGSTGITITDFAVRLPSGLYRGVFANVANSPPNFVAGTGFTCISMAYVGNVSMYLVTSANKAWIGYYGAGTTVAWVDLITAQDSGVGLLHSPPVITNFASPVASGEYRCLGSALNSPAELGPTIAASVLVGKGWTDEGFTTFLVTELINSAAPRVWVGMRTVAGGVPKWRQVLQMGDLGLGGHSGLETTLRPWQGNSFRGWATTAPDSPMGTNSVGLDMGYQENRRMQIAMSTSNLFMSRYTDDASGNAGWRMHYTTENVVGTVSANGPTRAIIESGENVNGKYTKFADGTMVAASREYYGGSAIANAGGAVFFGAAAPARSFPILFADNPAVTQYFEIEGTAAVWTAGTGLSAPGWWASCYPFSSVARPSVNLVLHRIAIGRWKI